MYMFGAGNVYIVPSGTNPTPLEVGTLQEVSLDFSFESKELYGNRQFPVMSARGKGKITGKAKSGAFRGGLISSILSGATSATGRRIGAQETSAIPTTPFTVTVTHSANFADDLGVIDVASGTAMSRVAATPATGEYSVAAGVYTFAAADTGKSVQISYSYSDAASGKTITYTNQLMGSQSIYSLSLYNTNPDGSKFGMKLTQVVFPKLALGWKNDDFTMPDLDISAFADSSGKILEAYVPEL